LFQNDPTYAQWNKEPVELVAVYAFGDQAMESILKGHGVSLEQYTPQWVIDAYVERLRRGYKKVKF